MYFESVCVASFVSLCLCCANCSVLPCRVFSCLVWSKSLIVHKGARVSIFTSARWARLSQPTVETTPVKSMLSYPHEPDDRMCVIAKRLGCFHRLAHAAGHGNFLGASATRRTLLLCLFTAATSFHIFGDTCPSGAAARCPAGRVTSVRQRRTSQSNFLESQRHFCNTPSVRHIFFRTKHPTLPKSFFFCCHSAPGIETCENLKNVNT